MDAPLCPVCAAAPGAPLETYRDPIEPRDYSIYACPGCGLVYAWPLKFPGPAWYSKFNYHAGYGETASGAEEGRFRHFLNRVRAPGGRLIDVGCAAGAFVAMAQKSGLRAEGLEMDEDFVKMARAAGVKDVNRGTLNDAFARERAGQYDAASIFEVFEHVEDPRDTLRRLRELLKPGGQLLLSVPDNRRPTPFGRDLWDYPPHHLTRWSPGPLKRLLEETGFEVEAIDAEPLEVWEYSRIWADRSAQWILKAIKAVLFGRGGAQRPMDDLLKDAASAGSGRGALLPEKGARVRLVALYHKVFHVLTYPGFLLMLGYYRLLGPECGLRLLVVARRKG